MRIRDLKTVRQLQRGLGVLRIPQCNWVSKASLQVFGVILYCDIMIRNVITREQNVAVFGYLSSSLNNATFMLLLNVKADAVAR